MDAKVLVTYATRRGTTVAIAETIARTLAETGLVCHVRPVKEVTTVAGYTAIAVGSAIRMGAWLPEAVQFVKTQQAALKRMPTFFFTACLYLTSPAHRDEVEGFTIPVKQIVTPQAEAFFAGAIDPNKLPFIFSWMMKSQNLQFGDFRDWDAIRQWAGSLAPAITHAIPVL